MHGYAVQKATPVPAAGAFAAQRLSLVCRAKADAYPLRNTLWMKYPQHSAMRGYE
jgi:hypothetical protein